MAAAVNLAELEPRRVCLIKPSALGDVVHATPVLAALRDRWPHAHIAWVVNRGLAPLINGLPELDELIPFDRTGSAAGPRGWMQTLGFFQSLRRRKFDLTVDLQGLLRSGLMTAATRAPVRVGLTSAREGSIHFYTHTIAPLPGTVHAVDRYLDVARALGATIREPRFLVPISAADRLWAQQTLAHLPGPRLIINVGARWETKRWPPEQFAAVANRAAAERGASIIAVGAPEDRPTVDTFRLALGGEAPWLDLCGRTSLPQLAALAAESDLVLSNDTGPLHLAVAAGARVVAVFTCTVPEKTGPYGPRVKVVKSEIWCAGTCVKTCPRMECMTELTADRVWRVVARQLDHVSRLERKTSAA